MKLSIGEIINAKEPLERLMGMKLPVKVSWKLAQLAIKLNEHLRTFQVVRKDLIKTYGDGGNVTPESPRWDEFRGEINELLAQEVELEFEKVKLPDTLEIEPSVLIRLEKFIAVS